MARLLYGAATPLSPQYSGSSDPQSRSKCSKKVLPLRKMSPRFLALASVLGLMVLLVPFTASAATPPRAVTEHQLPRPSDELSLLSMLEVENQAATPTRAPIHQVNRRRIFVRQDQPKSESSTPPPTSSTTSQSSSSTESSQKSQSSESSRSTASSSSSHTTVAPSETGTETIPSSTASPAAQDDSIGRSNGGNGNTLPLKPVVTPGIGIAGVILLGTGMVYALIGTKNRWLQIFFSVAFLASLAVTVLIIYLFNPPASPALEGGFLVAAVATGVAFGALANVFAEVTEGLGCLLGGFCLGMWFLCLKPGGLIHPHYGRIILLAAMSVTCYAFSFSVVTRSYALLVAAAFSGATAAILGIDCFSRAGLKEFWLYLWNLNADMFPLDTNTYPLTRGIRVELAGVVLLFLLGLVSQFKVWKLVQARRKRKNSDRLKEEEDLERLESEVGRRVNENVQQEKAIWERVYGAKPGTGSSDPADAVAEQSKAVSVAQDDTTFVGQEGLGAKSRVTDDSMDEDEVAELEGDPVGGGNVVSSDLTQLPFQVANVDKKKRRKSKKGSRSSHPTASVSPTGSAVEERRIRERASRGTIDEEEHEPAPEDEGFGNACSDRDSTDDSDGDGSSSGESESEAPRPAGIRKVVGKPIKGEDDDDSSIAATIDEIETEDDDLSGPVVSSTDAGVKRSDGKSRTSSRMRNPRESIQMTEGGGEQTEPLLSDEHETAGPSAVVSAKRKSKPTLKKSQSPAPRPKSKRSKAKSVMAKSIKAQVSTDGMTEEMPGSVLLKQEYLPDQRISKATRSFRTNEWAKHLELAEDPNSILPSDNEDAEKEAGGGENEAENASEKSPSRPPSPGVQIGFRVRPQSHGHSYKSPVTGTAPGGGFLSHRASARVSMRNVSAPVLNSGHPTSPVPVVPEEGEFDPAEDGPLAPQPAEPTAPATARTTVAGGLPLNTLLTQRNSMLMNKLSTVSFTNMNLPSPREDLENVPLSERKAALQQQQEMGYPPNLSRASSYGAGGVNPSASRLSLQGPTRQTSWGTSPVGGNLGFGVGGNSTTGLFSSYNNVNANNGNGAGSTVNLASPTGAGPGSRREAMMASWRESTAFAALTANSALPDEARRAAMISDRRQQQAERQSKVQRDSVQNQIRGEMMRSGDMIDAHRAAMMRLQSQAKQ